HVIGNGPHWQARGPAAAQDAHVVLGGNQRKGLLLHVHEPVGRNHFESLAGDQHDPAGRAVFVRDDGDLAALFYQFGGDAGERVEQHLCGVGNEDQVVVVVAGGQVAEDAAGSAVIGQVALDAEMAVMLGVGAGRLHGVLVD